jgi:hypothetical protein
MPLKSSKLPANEISVNEVLTKITTGQITTRIIKNNAGPIHGNELKKVTLWLTFNFLVPFDLESLSVAVAKSHHS